MNRDSARLLWRGLGEYRGVWRTSLLVVILTLLGTPLAFAMPLLEKQLIDEVLVPRRLELLPRLAGLYAGLWLLATANGIVGGGLRTYLTEQLTRALRQRLFVHCEALALGFSRREHSARTLSLFFTDAPTTVGFFNSTLLGTLSSLVALGMGATILISLSWQLAIAAAFLPPLVAGLAFVVTRPLRPATRRAQEKVAELAQQLQESLAGLREVIAFGREETQSFRFATTLGELLRLRMRVTMMESGIGAATSLFSLGLSLVLFAYGGYLVIQGQATLGSLVAMQTLFGLMYPPLAQLWNLGGTLQKALGAAERVYRLLDESPTVRDRPGARHPPQLAGAVRYERVTFAYAPGRVALHDVSLSVAPGEMVALVGPSGAGKTTLVSLLARLYDPTAGRVLVDGQDVRELTLGGLRSHIGMVFQDTFLFATSIRENLTLARPEADDAAIVAAAKAANAWEFIAQLPLGLDTPVGERGVQLSEGQKQRLAIARALLREPRILVLDEPTSALDARSERLLQSALDNLMRGRTTFVIAHRLATVRRADQILVLEEGRIVERGTHAELLEQGGLYRELFDLQFDAIAPPATNGARRSIFSLHPL